MDLCEAVSKMLQGVTPPLSVVSSQPSTSGSAVAGPPSLEIDEELMVRSKNLSSTLQKLYLWEKKLYQEVKVRPALFFAIIIWESYRLNCFRLLTLLTDSNVVSALYIH